MTEIAPHVTEPYAAAEQQRDAGVLGLWIFLATEVMMFGGLFMAVMVYRWLYPDPVRAASEHLYKWIGASNTAVLLTSSLTMALSVDAARSGRRRRMVLFLAATAGLGLLFLAAKGIEYALDAADGLFSPVGAGFPIAAPPAVLFIDLYLAATGLHALHLIVGVALVAAVAGLFQSGRLTVPLRAATVEVLGLYWHFIDLVWIFLLPILYLV